MSCPIRASLQVARNVQVTYPSNAPAVAIYSANPDTAPPDLDLDRITISAAPTNPNSPNGETAVTIVYFARVIS